MAKGDMDDFLKNYFRQIHAANMSDDVLAQLVDDKKKGILTKNQEEWFEKYLEEDPNSPSGYKAKDLPDPAKTNDLHEDELRKLYEAFSYAFAGMKSASADYSNSDTAAKQFVTDYFDNKQLFSIPQATDQVADAIKKIVKLLNPENPTKEQRDISETLLQIIGDNTKKDGKDEKVFSDVSKVREFIKNKCETGKYNSDTSVQNKIKKIANTLYNYLNTYFYTDNDDDYTNPNKKALAPLGRDLEALLNDDAFSKIEITKRNLDDFRDIYASHLLETLYRDKGIREKFRAYDKKNIIEKIDKAEGKISWQDPNSNDYVPEKKEDTLTPVQQVQKWVGDTYKNTLKKYEQLRGGHLFFGPHAKEICKAIDKEEISPADGLNGLLNKAEAVKGRITNKTVAQHFDWFVKTMKDVQKKCPKAVEGAWKDANQMRAVITEIILKATNPEENKDKDPKEMMDMAKTAMEIMTVMKYGVLTSKVMDAMKSTDFSIFSDGNLSWNKNEGIQFVTKAFDKTIKFAFKTVGFGVVIARNKIMMRNMKFTNKNNEKGGAFYSRLEKEKQRLNYKYQDDKKTTARLNGQNKAKIKEDEQTLKDLDTNYGINETTLSSKEADAAKLKNRLDTYQQNMDASQKRIEKYQGKHEEYLQNKAIVDEFNKLPADITQLSSEEHDKKAEIYALRLKIANLDSYVDPKTRLPVGDTEKHQIEEQLTEQLNGLEAELTEISNEKKDKESKFADPSYEASVIDPARTQMSKLQADNKSYEAAVADYENNKKYYDKLNPIQSDLEDKVQQFNDATKEITELNTAIDAREKALENWDDENTNAILELENYWNFLQSGKTTTWHLNLKKRQKKFDTNKEEMLANYVAKHGLRAA